MNARGYSLVELLISMAIILVLLVATGDAIVQTLHVQSFHADRAAMGRTVDDLAARLGEEARSATAVFIPSADVFGASNAAPAHEVDFFRRLSTGGDDFVAYRFDAASGDVTRYDYAWTTGSRVVTASDLAATGIGTFAVVRESAAGAGLLAGLSDPPTVPILYGKPEVEGGNDVIVASVQPKTKDGINAVVTQIHLASRAAPTTLAILVPKGVPTPPPTTQTFPFFILRPGFHITPPHGPWHGGSPGGPDSLIHGVAATGTAIFFTTGSLDGNWADFSTLYTLVDSGVFTFAGADGSSITAVIACSDGPCPAFHPVPISVPGMPAGTLAFEMST